MYICCCCSVFQSCPTLCDPIDYSMPGFSVLHHLLEFAQVHAHCIGDAIHLSHPLSPSSPSAFSLSQHQSIFQWIGCSHQVAKVLELQLQHQSFQWELRIDFLLDCLVWHHCCPRDSQESSPAPQFKIINSSALSLLYGPALTTICDYWKDCQFSSAQLFSHVWLFATTWTAASQASLSITNSQSLLKRMSIESVMPCNHLILCRPLLLLPSIFLSIRVIVKWVSSSHQVAKVLEFQLQHQSFQWRFSTDFL